MSKASGLLQFIAFTIHWVLADRPRACDEWRRTRVLFLNEGRLGINQLKLRPLQSLIHKPDHEEWSAGMSPCSIQTRVSSLADIDHPTTSQFCLPYSEQTQLALLPWAARYSALFTQSPAPSAHPHVLWTLSRNNDPGYKVWSQKVPRFIKIQLTLQAFILKLYLPTPLIPTKKKIFIMCNIVLGNCRLAYQVSCN